MHATAHTHILNSFTCCTFLLSCPRAVSSPTALTDTQLEPGLQKEGQTQLKQPRCQILTGHIDYNKGGSEKNELYFVYLREWRGGRGVRSFGPIASRRSVDWRAFHPMTEVCSWTNATTTQRFFPPSTFRQRNSGFIRFLANNASKLTKEARVCSAYWRLIEEFLHCVVFLWHPGPEKSRFPPDSWFADSPLFALEVVWWVCCFWWSEGGS